MQLTAKQEQGLKLVRESFQRRDPYACIAGYAGAGKSTLIRFIIDALNLDPETQVAYVAYTGKASEVLRSMGNPNATTAHKLLYHASQTAKGKYTFYPRKRLEQGGLRLIVVDEVSMLPKRMWEQLLKHKIFVLAAGDPFQLPPVVASDDNGVLAKPHIFLDEIMRQAKESEIIRLSMDIRAMKPIQPYRGSEINVLRKYQLNPAMFSWADQILCGINKTRLDINNLMRQIGGKGTEPEVDDKVICLHNSWDVVSDQGNPLVNGSIGWLKDMELVRWTYELYKHQQVQVPILLATIDNGCETYVDVPIDYNSLVYGTKTLTPRQEYEIKKHSEINPPLPIEFNYGYAITTHRAQGSQWRKVTVYEETFPRDKVEHARWLYTACTRPSQKLTLVLK